MEVFLSASVKAKLLAENFSKKINLDDASTSLPAFPPGTTLKMHNIPATPMLVKKAITNFDLLNASSPDCIPVMALKKCESKLLSLLANSSKCVCRNLVLQIVGRFHLCFLYLQMLGRGLHRITTTL